MTAEIVLGLVTQTRLLLTLLLALLIAGCGAADPAPQFTAPGPAAAGATFQVPQVPGGVQAVAGNAQVILTWSASTGATAYNVARSVMAGGPWIAVAQPTTNSYTDSGLTNGVAYYYVVAALNAAGASANSNQVTATPTTPATGVIMRAPAVPSGLQATAGNAQVMLTWMASTGATSYVLSRSTQSGGPWTQIAAPTTTAFTDTGLTNGTPYYYVVAAVSATGTSANSAPPVSATPAAPATTTPPAPPAPPVVGTGVGAGYWHTSGGRILDANGIPVRIAGINWYGFETTDHLVHGLCAQDYKVIINTIKSLGYNVIRLPFSNELVESNPVPTNFTTSVGGQAANTALVGKPALTDLDNIIGYAGSIGLRVILDNHRSEAGNSSDANGLWYTDAFPQQNWLADWQTLATRYSDAKFTFNGNPTVIGVELRNAPHLMGAYGTIGSCWTGDTATDGCPTSLTSKNWPVAAQAAGNAILAINPKLLIFVAGTDCYNHVCGWWGGNLIGVATHPVVLNVPNQLVYSAHDYGPALFRQPWFNFDTTSAGSLNSVWNQFWGYISSTGTAPVWLAEFGTGNSADDIQSASPGSQGQWFQSLIGYLQNKPSIGWTYWALNGEDRFSLLDRQYDPTPVSPLKQSLLQSIQFPLNGVTPALSH
jgi:endoglucanase